MEKQYIVGAYDEDPDKDDLSYDAALKSAKIRANKYSQDYAIFELKSVIKFPVPEMEVVALS